MNLSLIVQDFDQKSIDLIQHYPARPLLLLFYNNSCLGCTGRAIPLAHQIQQDYEKIQVIGVHSEFGDGISTEADIESIFRIDELPFPIYIDAGHRLYDSLSCEGTPHWILVSKNGELEKSVFGSQLGAQNRLTYALEELVAS